MTPSKDKYQEKEVNENFQNFLNRFHAFIEGSPKAEKIKEKLDALKLEAVKAVMTPHQKDAIIARCNNYLNGSYASTSKAPVHSYK